MQSALHNVLLGWPSTRGFSKQFPYDRKLKKLETFCYALSTHEANLFKKYCIYLITLDMFHKK